MTNKTINDTWGTPDNHDAICANCGSTKGEHKRDADSDGLEWACPLKGSHNKWLATVFVSGTGEQRARLASAQLRTASTEADATLINDYVEPVSVAGMRKALEGFDDDDELRGALFLKRKPKVDPAKLQKLYSLAQDLSEMRDMIDVNLGKLGRAIEERTEELNESVRAYNATVDEIDTCADLITRTTDKYDDFYAAMPPTEYMDEASEDGCDYTEGLDAPDESTSNDIANFVESVRKHCLGGQ